MTAAFLWTGFTTLPDRMQLLQGVPLYRALYEGTLNREEWSLIEVPKLAQYKGTVWASWDPQAPDFLTYLGDAVDHLDQLRRALTRRGRHVQDRRPVEELQLAPQLVAPVVARRQDPLRAGARGGLI